jgi:hypothetical protein
MAEVNDRETKLPLVVLDSMLPRQVWKLKVNNPLFSKLVRRRWADETPSFGMLGTARLAPTGERVNLRTGVQVDIIGKPVVDDEGIQLELRAGPPFTLVGEPDTAAEGWTEGRVKFLDLEDDGPLIASDRQSFERAALKATELSALADEWIDLARTRERQEGQIDTLLEDLGHIPTGVSDQAFWIGALINPLPALGVALEIRPALLTAQTPEDRVDVALRGIHRSIQFMKGEAPLVS